MRSLVSIFCCISCMPYVPKNQRRMAAGWLNLLICSLVVMNTQVRGDGFVNITILESAVAKGAVCLDGSPPAYAYLEGFGSGSANWIVYLQAGGWCTSKADCLERSKQDVGSSKKMASQVFFTGLLDTNCDFNPDFCNWHKVHIKYCDGSSFMSDVEKVDPETNLTFRGARIFNAMMEEMISKGMGNAQNAILTGTSAGGLATILHCDNFQSLLPNTNRVKCISDSGFFIDGKDLPGVKDRVQYFADVVATHELANSLPSSCTSRMDPGLCLFPEYLVGDVQTPLFIIDSAFDTFQVESNLIPYVGGRDEWKNCTTNLALCNSTQLGIMKDFRSAFIETLMKLDSSWSRGMFVHSCYIHGHTWAREAWTCSSVVGNVLANKTVGQAVGDWFFDRSSFNKIDIRNDSPRNCTNTLSWQCFNQKCLAAMLHDGSESTICNS